MPATHTSALKPKAPPSSTPSYAPPRSTDEPGLKSTTGIRWLLFVGAMVVVVSLIRLVASQWGLLPEPLQFLVLCAGALGIYGSGEIAGRRLRLPAAATALFSLFAVATPVLAWGAAHQNLARDLPGTAAAIGGLLALGWATKRLMGVVFDYRGWTFPICGLLLMVALPLGSLWNLPMALHAVLLGLLLAFGCRHINRFFFHRDRAGGIERPVHGLPFLFLIGLYLANVLQLGAGVVHWAIGLVFVALALAETGQEYLRALTRATGEMPTPWPARSVGLLAAAAVTGAAALGLAISSGHALTLVLVTGSCSAYLIAWSFRYRQASSYAVALPLGLISLHTLPALLTDLRDLCIQLASNYFEVSGFAGKAGAAASGELALLATLVAAGACLRLPRIQPLTTPSMLSVHGCMTALLACWTLTITAVSTNVVAQIAPAVAVLCWIAARLLHRVAPLFPAHLGVIAGAFAWIGPRFELELWSPHFLALNAALAVTYGWLSRSRSASLRTTAWALAGPIAVALVLFGLSSLIGSSLSVWSMVWSTVPILVLAFRLNLPKLAAPTSVVSLAALEWALLTTFAPSPGATALAAILLNALLVVSFWWADRLRRTLDPPALPASAALGSAVRSGHFTALALGLLWMPEAVLAGAWSTVASAVFLLIAGCTQLDLALIRSDGSSPSRAPSLRSTSAMLGLGLIPALLLFAIVQDLAPIAWIAIWLVGSWTLHRIMGAPRSIYQLGRLYRSRPSAVAALETVIESAARNAHVLVSVLAVIACLIWTGPWALAISAFILADMRMQRSAILQFATRRAAMQRSESTSAQEADGLRLAGLLLGLHWTLFAPQSFLVPILFELADAPGFALARLMLGLSLWQALSRRLPESPWASWLGGAIEAGAAILMVTSLPSSWAGVATLGMGLFFIARQLPRAWRHDDRRAAWIAQAWSVAWLVSLSRLTLLDLAPSWLSLILIGVAFLFLVARDALLARNRPAVATSLVPTGALLALIGAGMGSMAVAPWTGFAALPLGLASLYFALQVHGRLWPLAASAAAMLFVGCSFELLTLFPGLGWEAHLIGPGLALLAGATGLERRLGSRMSRYLFTLGAGCLYAVPSLALMRQLSWGSLLLLLVMSVAFGALSFRLRSRSLLLTSTGAVLIDLGFFLFMISKTPVLLWVLGVVFGLALMAVAAFLESRREQALQQARLWRQELQSWA